MDPIYIRYLSGHDVAALEFGNDEILDAIETSLRAQGEGETVIEPRTHLVRVMPAYELLAGARCRIDSRAFRS